jgi:hypothetical protein
MDWCKTGMRFSLCDCPSEDLYCCQTSWKLICANNWYTHKAKADYTTMEGECMSAAWSLDKACHFLLGCTDLILAVYYKPLLKVLGDRKLEHITNPHLQSLKKKTLLFLF